MTKYKRIGAYVILPPDWNGEMWDVDPATDCWVWLGPAHLTSPGVRRPYWGRQLAYRRLYSERVGTIPDGHHLHHECENPMCVNPDHMEPLTPAEHAKRHRGP